jgi:hypothetical protein
MSIVRWCKQADGKVSDVYIFHSNVGIQCMSAVDSTKDFTVKTPEACIAKLRELQGHHIPEFLFNIESYE